MDYQKKLPSHLQATGQLLCRLRDVFWHLPWCSTLYHRTELHDDGASFVQKLISAAAKADPSIKVRAYPDTHINASTNSDLQSSSEISELVLFCPTNQPSSLKLSTSSLLWSYFGQLTQRHALLKDHSGPRVNWPMDYTRVPLAPLRQEFRTKLVYFACRSRRHLLRDCLNKACFRHQLQAYVNMGKAATYLLDRDATELNFDDQDVLQFFNDIESSSKKTTSSAKGTTTDGNDSDTWIASLLEVYNYCTCRSPGAWTFHLEHRNDSRPPFFSIPNFLQELTDMMHEQTFYSLQISPTYLLLDTGASKRIRRQSWLTNNSCSTQNIFTLRDQLPPFRFAGHPVHALHGAFLTLKINDIHDADHMLGIIVFVLPDTPIPFL